MRQRCLPPRNTRQYLALSPSVNRSASNVTKQGVNSPEMLSRRAPLIAHSSVHGLVCSGQFHHAPQYLLLIKPPRNSLTDTTLLHLMQPAYCFSVNAPFDAPEKLLFRSGWEWLSRNAAIHTVAARRYKPPTPVLPPRRVSTKSPADR